MNNLTDKELNTLDEFTTRFGNISDDDIDLLLRATKVFKKLSVDKKKSIKSSDITNDLYSSNDMEVIDNFEKEYGRMQDINYYYSLIQLHKQFIENKKTFYTQTEEGLVKDDLSKVFPQNRYLNMASMLNIRDDNEDKNLLLIRNKVRQDLIQILETIAKLGEATKTKVFEDEFDVTVPEIAAMFELSEGYITRNLMHEFTFFNMSRYARFYIKSINSKIDKDFVNKKVFIKREDYDDFIENKVKFTDFKKQIILQFTDEEKIALLNKFKNDADVNKAITVAVNILDSTYVTERPKRKDQEKYKLTNELLNKIYSNEYKMMSMKALRKHYEEQAREELKAREDYNEKEYKFVSYNDYQVYYNKLNKMTFARLVVDGVKSKSSQYGTQTKTIVRYLVDTKMIKITAESVEKHEDNMYSIFNITYKKLESKMHKDEGSTIKDINEYIKKEIYNIMMDKDFKI